MDKVLKFWFEELTPKDWWQSSDELDKRISDEFGDLHRRVASGEFADNRETAEDYLAEIIVLDQFSRNMFRGSGESFAYDDKALSLAKEAIEKGLDKELEADKRQFMYMPFMHSESRSVHEEALKLFESFGREENLKFEKIHKDIIDRFGRYPHRNEQLGRESTEEEKEYLANNHESFF